MYKSNEIKIDINVENVKLLEQRRPQIYIICHTYRKTEIYYTYIILMIDTDI